MNVLRNILFALGAFFTLIMSSCISDDFTYSPEATLSFSTDTVSFGTVFTDLTTPTARLLVFNRNKKGVNISTIRFRNPETPFRINVDGVSGNEFQNVEIRGNDSIYIFIECLINADNSIEPRLVNDQLEFLTNGVTQEVEVEAWGWNVTRLRGESITTDTKFTSERPYIIFDSLVVEKGTVLTIEPGAMILFHDKAGMKINGSLHALGEPCNMIQMRGDRLDDVLPDIGYDVLAGQWEGIRFTKESFNNRMEYVDVRSTEMGLVVDSCGNISKRKLELINCWIHNSKATTLFSEYAWVDAYGCCFSEAAEAVVRLIGGIHNFVQCTIANNYLFTSWGEPNLALYHVLPTLNEGTGNPLMAANFNNLILWGKIGDPINLGDLTDTDVYFRNMLIKADGTDDDHFIDCIWNEDPLFYTIRNDYYFNYRLQPDSPAIGAGNPDYVVPQAMIDMDGINRLADGNPALGAYAFDPDYTVPEDINKE